MSDWQTIVAVDFDNWACRTFKANFPGTHVICGLVEDAKLPSADVIIGGPPCQGFSKAGKGLGDADERNGVPAFIDQVRSVQPRQFIMENVEGMLAKKHEKYIAAEFRAMEECGYKVDWKILHAEQFGTPQFRSRVFFWGIRSDLPFVHRWPRPTHQWPAGGDMFETLPTAPSVGEALVILDDIRTHHGPGFGERRDHPADEPAPTITGISRSGGSSRVDVVRQHSERFNHRRNTSAFEPASTVTSPTRGVGNGGALMLKIVTSRGPKHGGDVVETITQPSSSIRGATNRREFRVYHHTDAMFRKHPPAFPALPAPTINAKWYKGGAEGLLAARPWTCKDDCYIRRLSVAECMRLQSMPFDYVWPRGTSRTDAYKIVGNGWSCRVGHALAQAVRAVDPDARTVISLFCGGGLADCGWHGRFS